MTYGGDSSFNRRNQKLIWREILKMEPAVQKPLRHSETLITFSREDQWTSFSEPGKFPLVLDPVIAGSILTRVLIDGGSGLNLIFMNTITKMGLNISDKLKPSKAPFYGIVPRNVKQPGFSKEEPESLYRRDSPWISSYHIQNSFQAVN